MSVCSFVESGCTACTDLVIGDHAMELCDKGRAAGVSSYLTYHLAEPFHNAEEMEHEQLMYIFAVSPPVIACT